MCLFVKMTDKRKSKATPMWTPNLLLWPVLHYPSNSSLSLPSWEVWDTGGERYQSRALIDLKLFLTFVYAHKNSCPKTYLNSWLTFVGFWILAAAKQTSLLFYNVVWTCGLVYENSLRIVTQLEKDRVEREMGWHYSSGWGNTAQGHIDSVKWCTKTTWRQGNASICSGRLSSHESILSHQNNVKLQWCWG